MAYPCLIVQLCLDLGVQELPGITKIIEATNILGLHLIRDTTNPMARKVRQGADILVEIFRHNS